MNNAYKFVIRNHKGKRDGFYILGLNEKLIFSFALNKWGVVV